MTEDKKKKQYNRLPTAASKEAELAAKLPEATARKNETKQRLANEAANRAASRQQNTQSLSSWRTQKQTKEEAKPKQTKWYKGSTPTEIETLAQIVKISEQDEAKGRELFGGYEQAKQEGMWAETYDKATSSYMTSLGLTPDQVNEDFFLQMLPEMQAGTLTAAGNQSSGKKNKLAYELEQLRADWTNTVALENESNDMAKEIQYWVDQGLTDDEIRQKVALDGAGASNYKKLAAAQKKTLTGEVEPTTKAIAALTSYGVDGMIWAARNPGKSTGDYKLDAVQGAMGRGAASPTQSDPRRDVSSASYAPYAVGMSGMDEYGIKYGRTSFDEEWLNSPEGQAVRNNPDTNKDFGVIYDAVEKTKTYKAAVDEFVADIRADIEAGVSPDEIFSPEMLDDYPEIRDLLEAQAKGNPLKTSESLNFDIEALYKEAETAYVKNVGKVTSEEFEDDLSEKLGTPSKKNSATAGVHTQTQQQLMAARSIFARSATPEEKSVFATYSPGYADTKATALDGILNGTSEDNQAFYSAMGAADNYAASKYLPARKKLDELQSDLAAIERHEAFLTKWDESKYAGQVDEDGRPLALSQIYGNDEFLADQAADEGDLAVWKKYHGDTTGLKAEIAAQEKILGKIKANYEDAAKLNTNGVSGGSIMPMLEFIEQFDAYVPQRFADTEWGYRMAKGETWEQVSGSLDETRANNMYLIKMIDTAISQAEKYGIGDEYLKGMKRARQSIEEENRLIDYEKLRDQKDFMSAVEAFNDTQEPYKPGILGISFGAISREEDIRNAVVDLDSYILTSRGERSTNAALVAVMSDSELNTYKYLFETKGEAEATAYFDSLTPMLNVRQSESFKQRANDDVDTWYGVAGANIASVAINALTAVPTLIASAGQAIKGEVDPYSAPFWLNTYSQSAREETKNNISSMTEKQFGQGSWQEKLALFGYEAVMTGLDSYASGKLGSAFAGVGKVADVEAAKKVAARTAGALMSANAGATSLMDAKMRGATDWQAFAYAGITALTEYCSEKIPMETWLGIEEGDFKTFWKSFVEGVATDAPGEMLSEVAGTVSDKIIMQELSNWDTAYEQYRAMGMSDAEARSQRLWDTVNNILYAGMLSVGTTAISTGLKSTTIKVFGGKKNFKARAETALYEAAAKSASKGDTAATVEAVMEAMGSDPVEASAAAHVLANVDPNVASTTASILAHTEDPSVMDALRLGALVPDSQTGQILSDIQKNGATDENVADLIEVSKLESDEPEIQSQYGEAVKKNVEAMAVVNALLGTDNKPINDAKATVAKAEQNLATQRKTVSDAEAEMQAATSAMENAKKRFNAKPSDPKAKAAMEKSVVRYQEAQKTLENARATTDIGKAVEELKAARKALETTRNELMTAARSNAQTVVQDNMVQMQQRKVEAVAVADEQRQSDNVLAIETENFIRDNFPDADLTDEETEKISVLMRDRDADNRSARRETAKANLRWATAISKKFGVQITFRDTSEGGKYLRYNGMYDPKSDSIVIDSNATQSDVIYGILLHELTHKAERSETYTEYANAILSLKYGNDSEKLAADIRAKQKSYNSKLKKMAELDPNVDATELTADEASREIVADLTREILYGDEESIQKLCEEKPGVAKRILETIRNLINKLRGVKDPAVDQLNNARKLFEKSLTSDNAMPEGKKQYLIVRATDGDTAVTFEEDLPEEKSSVKQEIKTDSGEVVADIIRGSATKQYSLASWTEKERKTVRNALVKNGYSEADADKWISDVDGVASIVANDKARLDYEADQDQVMLKNNQEYVKTLDASTLCAKRLLYQGTFNEIQHMLPNTVLTSDDLLDLLNIMKDAGYETPCGICYVESRRRHLGKFAEQWLNGRPATKEQKAWEPYSGEYIPTLDELTTTDGLANLKKEHPAAYNDFMKKMRSLGSSNPKIVELRTDYRGDIRKLTASQREKITKIGGLRVQSFSDFETPHLLDMMQAVVDMAGGKLTSQAYTKVPNFAWVFGDTGIKINLSLIADGTGLDSDGNLVFSSSEGMDFDEAMRLRERYSKNVGTILVGVSDDHIRAAMNDPRIDYIIPFHRSGWGQNELKKVSVLQSYTDYQATQNERMLDGSKPEGGNLYPIDYWDYDKSGDENAAVYLKLCETKGRIPKFEQFLTKDADGHWVAPSGYWKMLIDFKMYDNDGNGAPQQVVQPNFNMQETERVLSEYKGGANTLPVAYDIVDRFVSEYKAANPRQQYALPSDNMLTEMVDSYLMQNNIPEQSQRPQGERQFVRQTMPNTEAVPEWIWREFQNNPDELNYDIDTNREQVERGWQRIQREGHDVELNRLMEAERFSADDTAEANLMMAMALHNDDPATFMALASKYNKEGTEAGKELQARKLFSKMTPTGARIWIAGRLENGLGQFIRGHQPMKERIERTANEIANEIRNLDNTNYLRLLESNEDVTINSSNNRWGTPINAQQQALIDHYNLNNVARPGIFYNRATTEQRMLEAILATPNPLEITGNGLNLIQRLEFIQNGAAVVTNADLNYIGARLGEFIGNGAETGGRNADVAIARAYEAFGNITPATTGEKYRTWRYISMLTSVPSALRNVIGNVTMNAVNATAHGVAVEIDKIVSSFTGHRTAEHLSVNERVAGWNAFVEETKNTFRDFFVDRVTTQRGNDRYSTNQRGRVFQSSALEAARNVESFMMSFGDRNVWRKAYVNSLAEQQKLADQNLLFNADGTPRTHDQMLEQAEHDANYATFSENNQMSNLLGQMKRIPGVGHVVDFIMPFTGVPVNITNRMIQYAPTNLAVTMLRAGWQAAHGQTFDQQAFVQGISRGLTGTALFGVGLILAEMGAIKLGTGEEEDKKKYGLQTAMGEQYTPYIYNPFTDEYVSLAIFSPAASSLTMGAAAWMDFKNNDNALQALKNAAFGSIDQIFDASYMSGVADLFGGYGSFGERLLNTLFNNVVSQSVPTVLGQLANSMDPYVRDTKDKSATMQALKSGVINKIPFLREQLLPVKIDVTGQPVRTKEGLRNFYDPFTTTDARNEPVVDELFRLNEVLGSSSMLPSDVLSGTKDSITFNKQTVTLDDAGKEAYRRRYGELWLEGGVTLDKKGKKKTVEGLRELMESRRYQLMDDEEKDEAVAEIIKAADTGVKMEALRDYGNQ